MDSKFKKELEDAYIQRGKEIFTDLNIGPIVFYLQRLIPQRGRLIKDDQFSTIVSCAEIDGMNTLIEKVQTSVLGMNNEKQK